MGFLTKNDHFRVFWRVPPFKETPMAQCMKCRQGAVDVVVFVVEVVVVEVVVERCSVKITVAVSTSICVTTSVIVVGFLEPSASSSTEVFVVVVDVAAAVVGAAVVAAADVVGATVSAAVVAAVVAATVVSAASGSCFTGLRLEDINIKPNWQKLRTPQLHELEYPQGCQGFPEDGCVIVVKGNDFFSGHVCLYLGQDPPLISLRCAPSRITE